MPTRRTRMDAVAGSGFRSLGRLLAPPLESRSAARKRSGCGERRMSAMAKAAPKPTATPTSTDDQERLSGWQQRALDRSLVEAKRRALDKSNGFVKAAMELLDETGASTSRCRTSSTGRSSRSAASTRRSRARTTSCCAVRGVRRHRGRLATRPHGEARRPRGPDPRLPHQPVGRQAQPRGGPGSRGLQHDALVDPSRRSRARTRAAAPVLLEAVERGIASGQVRDDIGSRRLAEILLHTGNAAVQTTILHTGNESPTTSGRSASAVCAPALNLAASTRCRARRTRLGWRRVRESGSRH